MTSILEFFLLFLQMCDGTLRLILKQLELLHVGLVHLLHGVVLHVVLLG